VAQKTTQTFWQRVKIALKEKRLPPTQAYIAKRLRIKQPSISDWNKPGGFPEMGRVVEIAVMLDVTVDWLYTGREPMRIHPPDALGQRLWSLWSRLDDAVKGELIGIARASSERGGDTSRALPAPPSGT
jgi:hypothetical protein